MISICLDELLVRIIMLFLWSESTDHSVINLLAIWIISYESEVIANLLVLLIKLHWLRSIESRLREILLNWLNRRIAWINTNAHSTMRL